MDTRKDNKVCNFSLFINISIVEFSGCAQFVRGIVPLVYIQAPALVVAPRVGLDLVTPTMYHTYYVCVQYNS